MTWALEGQRWSVDHIYITRASQRAWKRGRWSVKKLLSGWVSGFLLKVFRLRLDFPVVLSHQIWDPVSWLDRGHIISLTPAQVLLPTSCLRSGDECVVLLLFMGAMRLNRCVAIADGCWPSLGGPSLRTSTSWYIACHGLLSRGLCCLLHWTPPPCQPSGCLALWHFCSLTTSREAGTWSLQLSCDCWRVSIMPPPTLFKPVRSSREQGLSILWTWAWALVAEF